MSGKDERKGGIFPPECPVCGNCYEWYIGRNTWILTEKSMKKRGLLYPVIRYSSTGVPVADNTYIHCAGDMASVCGRKFYYGSKTHKGVIGAFYRNHGKPYHRSIRREAIDNEW